jgi:hypothetical protein
VYNKPKRHFSGYAQCRKVIGCIRCTRRWSTCIIYVPNRPDRQHLGTSMATIFGFSSVYIGTVNDRVYSGGVDICHKRDFVQRNSGEFLQGIGARKVVAPWRWYINGLFSCFLFYAWCPRCMKTRRAENKCVVPTHGLARSAITLPTPGSSQRHHTMLWACCARSAHSTQKPIASAIFPREVMTQLTPKSADPANLCTYPT